MTFYFTNPQRDATILLDDVQLVATPMYTVTPSITGGSGTIAPNTPQVVNEADSPKRTHR